MRRIFAVVLVVSVLLSGTFNCSVCAASNTYSLDELGIKVTVPVGYSVITRDTPAGDSIFSELGTTKAAVIVQFETSNIYLNAISNTCNEEIVVTNMKNSINNFSSFSDTLLNTLAATLVEEYKSYGINISKYEIYQHTQAKFIKVYFTDTANTVHGLQYYTIYNGNAMNFTIRSYEGSLSARQEATIKTIVDSVKYNISPPAIEEGKDTDSFKYTDSDSGVTFTVPNNWKEEPFTKEREFIDVKFISTKEDGGTMIYGSVDIWEKMTESEKIGYTRSDINNSEFTKSDIAAMYNTTTDKISIVTYNGVQYFKAETNYTSDSYGVDITVKMTQLVYIDNGWMYSFQFGGTSTHKLYSDFESLLKSVQYHNTVSNVNSTQSVSSVNSANYSINQTTDESSGVGVIILLIIIAIILVIVITVSHKKRKEQIAVANYAPIDNVHKNEQPSKLKQTVYCRNCGQELPIDSCFCHICGTKL